MTRTAVKRVLQTVLVVGLFLAFCVWADVNGFGG